MIAPGLVSWLGPAAAGLLGLAVGSFLNVCTVRWPLEESVVRPRSRCPSCGAAIRWRDNIPVLSWLLLRGRCRSCGESISLQYPLVELATGLIWAGMFVQAGFTWEALRGSLFLTLLFGIAVADARFYIIPDEFTLGGAVLGLGLAALPGGPTLLGSAVGAVSGFAILWLIGAAGSRLLGEDAMGGGDVKMMALIGSFLGLPGTLLTLFLGAFLGAVIFGPISWKTGRLVPFGVFLAAGAAVAYAWGDVLIGWYVTEMLAGAHPG